MSEVLAQPNSPELESELAAERPRYARWQALKRRPTFLIAATIIAVMLVMAAIPGPFASLFGHGDPRNCNLVDSALPPSLSSGHPFGFDIQGCDVYANVVYGARTSIPIGLLATGTSFLIAVVLGSMAGFYGGWFDTAVSRVIDVFFGFPFILGAIILLTSFPNRNVWTVSLVLALFSWPTGTRLMRSSVLSVMNAEYIASARALGASDARLIARHVIPNAIAPLLVLATLLVGTIIAAEATLTFLGVGLKLPAISWGLQLATAQQYLSTSPHMLIFPSLFLGVTVLGFVLLGDALRDAFDPKLN
jgi:ABC-type dipeptide/oligopeptide/nickel transport system permease subunit